MNVPKLIPAGTLVRLGRDPKCTTSSYDMLVRTTEDSVLKQGNKYNMVFNSKVLENPNRWHSNTVTHSIDLNYDTIVYIDNKHAKVALERYDD